MTLNGVSYSIVGIMPPGFAFQNADLWMRDEKRLDPHHVYLLPVLGRLKPGISRKRRKRNFRRSLPTCLLIESSATREP